MKYDVVISFNTWQDANRAAREIEQRMNLYCIVRDELDYMLDDDEPGERELENDLRELDESLGRP
jgi:hypothetical protein